MTTTTQATTDEQRSELLENLNQKVEALRTSEGWTDWLAVASKFHRYSVNNQMLIWIQNPDATYVTGYGNKDHTTGWLSLGRQVRKGEKAIRIYAPITRMVPVDARGVQCAEKDAVDKAKRITGFKLVPVFDISQTDGDPLPESPAEAWRREWGQENEGDDRHYKLARDAVDALGLRVIEEDETAPEAHKGAKGWHEPGSSIVHVVRDNPGRMVKTLFHETAHALDDEHSFAEYARGELVAESVSYLLANEIGLTADKVATTYLAGWHGDTDKLTALANRVLKITRKISDAMFPEKKQEAA